MNRKYLAPLLTAVILILAVFLGIEIVKAGRAEAPQTPAASQTQQETQTALPTQSAGSAVPEEPSDDPTPETTAAPTAETQPAPQETTAPTEETKPASKETTPEEEEETESSLPPNMLPIG